MTFIIKYWYFIRYIFFFITLFIIVFSFKIYLNSLLLDKQINTLHEDVKSILLEKSYNLNFYNKYLNSEYSKYFIYHENGYIFPDEKKIFFSDYIFMKNKKYNSINIYNSDNSDDFNRYKFIYNKIKIIIDN